MPDVNLSAKMRMVSKVRLVPRKASFVGLETEMLKLTAMNSNATGIKFEISELEKELILKKVELARAMGEVKVALADLGMPLNATRFTTNFDEKTYSWEQPDETATTNPETDGASTGVDELGKSGKRTSGTLPPAAGSADDGGVKEAEKS